MFSPIAIAKTVGAGLLIAAVVWISAEILNGRAASARADRLESELATANAALVEERALLEKRTADFELQLHLAHRAAARDAAEDEAAARFEEALRDFGAPVAIPPLIERTIREVFP